MSTNNDGGPAFPTVKRDGHAGAVTSITDKAGMTLRDYFAANAMQGTLGNSSFHDDNEEALSKWCYRMADAMLAARENAQ